MLKDSIISILVNYVEIVQNLQLKGTTEDEFDFLKVMKFEIDILPEEVKYVFKILGFSVESDFFFTEIFTVDVFYSNNERLMIQILQAMT